MHSRAARLQNVSTTAVEISELASTRVERIDSANTLAITCLRPEVTRHHQLEKTSYECSIPVARSNFRAPVIRRKLSRGSALARRRTASLHPASNAFRWIVP